MNDEIFKEKFSKYTECIANKNYEDAMYILIEIINIYDKEVIELKIKNDKLYSDAEKLREENKDLKRVEEAAFSLGPDGCDPICCINNAKLGLEKLQSMVKELC